MATIQGIYVALFGRPADPAGLAFFNEATNNGADLTAIGDLAATDEYQTRFTGMTNEEIINSIYQSLFGRDGEADGIAFFIAELEAGRLNINNIAIAILDGAQGDDLLTVNAKIAAADIFTTHLDQQVEVDAYAGAFAAGVGRDFLNTVNKDDPGTDAEADTAILRLFDQGQQPGGGFGGGSTPTFIINNEGELGLTFGGTATGAITLGQEFTEPTPTEELLQKAVSLGTSVLTGERGNVDATFVPNTPVDATYGVRIADLPADLVLTDGLSVSLSAETASNHEISGDGNTCVTGSEGEQNITVSTTGYNHIEGGQDKDTITLGEAGTDHIQVNGVDQALLDAVDAAETALEGEPSAEELAGDLADAEAALEEARGDATDDELDQHLVDAQGDLAELVGDSAPEEFQAALQNAVDDASADVAEASDNVDTKQDAYDDASAVADAAQDALGDAEEASDTAVLNLGALAATEIRALLQDAYDYDIPGGGPDNSNQNRSQVTAAINALSIDSGLKTALIGALPAPSSGPGQDNTFNNNGQSSAYLNKIAGIVSNFLSGGGADTGIQALAVETLKDRLTDAYYEGDDSSSSGNRADVQEEINSLTIPAGLKAALIAAIPAGSGTFDSNGELTGYLNAVGGVVTTFLNTLATTESNAQTALDEANDAKTEAQGALETAQDALTEAQSALDDATGHLNEYNSAVSAVEDAQAAIDERDGLVNDVTEAQAAVDDHTVLVGNLEDAQGALDGAAADSVVGAEDHVTGFQLHTDTLDLPSTNVVANVTDLNFTYEGNGYVLNVANGIATLTEAEDGDPVVPEGEALADALAYLSNDDIVADGETIAFYFDADEDGDADDLYVFQGAPGAADIGVVLIGVEGVTDVRDLFNVQVA